jgi:hypothetical protein
VEAYDKRLRTVSPEITGRGWVKKLFENVRELGRKPLEAEVVINDIDVTFKVPCHINYSRFSFPCRSFHCL